MWTVWAVTRIQASMAKSSSTTPPKEWTCPQLSGDPIVNKVTYTADQMLQNHPVQITPAELFKTNYNQTVRLILLDVRPESDYNLYLIKAAANFPLDEIESIVPDLLSEPPSNSVFATISNAEAAATQAWNQLVASGVPNVHLLEGGINPGSSSLATKRTFNRCPHRSRIISITSSLRHWAASMLPAIPTRYSIRSWISRPGSSLSLSVIRAVAGVVRSNTQGN
jgi:rhodanese-related sulfurtransferase